MRHTGRGVSHQKASSSASSSSSLEDELLVGRLPRRTRTAAITRRRGPHHRTTTIGIGMDFRRARVLAAQFASATTHVSHRRRRSVPGSRRARSVATRPVAMSILTIPPAIGLLTQSASPLERAGAARGLIPMSLGDPPPRRSARDRPVRRLELRDDRERSSATNSHYRRPRTARHGRGETAPHRG